MKLNRHQRRSAFTLVEMMVASALIIFMMWIIATAFEKGLTSFRVLKTAGDMQEKLRAATTAIRRDLTRPHFEKVDSEPWGGENLSEQRMDDLAWQPPNQGYFRVYKQVDGDPDGPDADDPTMEHRRSPKADGSERIGHVLQFTNKVRGIRRDQYYMVNTRDPNGDAVYGLPTAVGNGRLSRFNFPIYNRSVVYPIQAPSGTGLNSTIDGPTTLFSTVWAEVCYFVRPNGELAGNTPLYNLYRQQNLLVTDMPDTVAYASPPSPRPLEIDAANTDFLEVSAWRTGAPVAQVNSPKTATAPARRIGADPASPAGAFPPTGIRTFTDLVNGNLNHPMASSDLLLTNVTNFEIKLLWEPAPGGSAPQPFSDASSTIGNPDYPFDRLPPGNNPLINALVPPVRMMDTWSKRTSANNLDNFTNWNVPGDQKFIPLRVRVRAIQIELRIWDVKSQQSRQITIIQDV